MLAAIYSFNMCMQKFSSKKQADVSPFKKPGDT